MNGFDTQFKKIWTGSLVAHFFFFTLVFFLPMGGPQQSPMPVYHVKLIDTPQSPEVRELSLSTKPISKLEPQPPPVEIESTPTEAPKLAEPVLPSSPKGLGVGPLETPPGLKAPDLTATEKPTPLAVPRGDSLPSLPGLPSENQSQDIKPLAKPEGEKKSPAATPPPNARPMERLRKKMQSMQLQFEEPKLGVQGLGPSAANRSFFSLRFYQNRLREEIKDSYTFPGGFEPGLAVRVRLTIKRNGSVEKIDILESSGNKKFDYAALLSLRRARFPPFSKEMEGGNSDSGHHLLALARFLNIKPYVKTKKIHQN